MNNPIINSFDNFDKNFRRMRRIVTGFLVTVFVLIITIWITLAVLGVRGCNHIRDKGLQSVVQDVWTGNE